MKGYPMAVLDFGAPQKASLFSRIGASLATFGANYIEARSRTAEFQYYTEMSDAQLAEKGMRREDIALHVFRDHIL